MTPQQKETLLSIHEHYFGSYKQEEGERYKRLISCSRLVRSPQQYYDCVDRINEEYGKKQNKMKQQIKKAEKSYKMQKGKCSGNRECEQQELTKLANQINLIYNDFYHM